MLSRFRQVFLPLEGVLFLRELLEEQHKTCIDYLLLFVHFFAMNEYFFVFLLYIPPVMGIRGFEFSLETHPMQRK